MEACRKIRKIASQTCLLTLQNTLNKNSKVSEINFKNRWNKELEKSWNKGYVDNWYDHPPDGIAAIFGDEKDFTRVNYSNLRIKEYWPKLKSFFNEKGLAYLFASPYVIHNNVPIIGDFGLTYYLGSNDKIIDHYKRSYSLLNKLIDNIKTGMSFKELYITTFDMIQTAGLMNFVVAITDKAKTDFGHTIPFVDRNPEGEEIKSIDSGDPKLINKAISEARVFINAIENYEISDNCAFTFEPRLTNPDKSLPIFSFHTIIQFAEGKKVVAGNFEGIINFLGMDWINS